MKKIPLTQNKFALVDDRDFGLLNRHKWFALKGWKTFYAVRNSPEVNKLVYMHREILNTPARMDTDHINKNGLDNQRQNLRVATRSENLQNQGKQKPNTSGFKGVHWNKGAKKWVAQIKVDKKQVYLGMFTDKITAFEAYKMFCLKHHRLFANTN